MNIFQMSELERERELLKTKGRRMGHHQYGTKGRERKTIEDRHREPEVGGSSTHPLHVPRQVTELLWGSLPPPESRDEAATLQGSGRD